ncbi:MAG: septum formation initiator family protein [Parvibaculaceae bacterium]
MRRFLFDLAVTAVCLSLLGFVTWHGLYGSRSLDRSRALDERVETLEASLSSVRAEREAFESQVRLLRPDSIDPDLVGELARKTLGFTRQGDIVVDLGR